MPDPLLVTKVRLPLLRHILVPREKALRQISQGIQEEPLLTLVSAPAGYGETIPSRMWVEQAGNPIAWVTLETSDTDLKQFLIYLLTVLQQADDHHQPHRLRSGVSSSPKTGFQESLTCYLANPLVHSSQGTKGNREHKCIPQPNPDQAN